MDGLLGMDPEQLKAMMAQFGATPQDTADANKQAAFALGFGLLQGRKGNELATIGHAGLGAMGARNAALMNSQQLRQEGLKNAMGMAKLAQAAQAQQGQQQMQGRMAGIFGAGPQLENMGPGGPTPANAEAVAPPSQIERYRKAAAVRAEYGDTEGAKRLADIANAMEEQYSTTPQTVKGPNGEIQLAQFSQRGKVKVAEGLSPAEKLHFADTGGALLGLNPFTGKQEGAALPKTVSPDTQFSGNITMRGQNMADARSREANAAAGPVIETAQGFARIGKDNTVTPITAAGAQLQPKPTGAIAQQIATNNVTLAKIDRAMDLVDKTPDAFGAQNMLGDPVMQRLNPSGVNARAMVADIAGQKIHDRSGAAVTIGEAERLKPYIPNVTDTAPVIKKKLGMFKQEYQAMQTELAGGKSIAAAAAGNKGGASGGWSIKEVK